VVVCVFVETPEFCSVNFTSPDLASLTDVDNLTISCGFSYHGTTHWTPHVECLPYVHGQTEVMNNSADGVTYRKSFQASSDINGDVLRCIAKFNHSRPEHEHNRPDDIELWSSAFLQVQCKHQLLKCILGHRLILKQEDKLITDD